MIDQRLHLLRIFHEHKGWLSIPETVERHFSFCPNQTLQSSSHPLSQPTTFDPQAFQTFKVSRGVTLSLTLSLGPTVMKTSGKHF